MVYSFESEEEKTPALTEGQNWILASLFNLIVVSDSLQQALRCQELVRLVTEKFPCRVFLIQTDETSETDFFHTQHTVQATGSGSTRVCYDQITIDSSPGQLRKAPFVILPKILPDLPVYVLLGHDPTQDLTLLPELQKFATRIVFDSQSIDNVQSFAERMLATMQAAHNDFVDINWAKTKAWREVMARVFDTLEKQALLSQSKLIQITYCCPAAQGKSKLELQSLYLQSWLGAQLGWNFLNVKKEDGTFRVQYQSGDLPLEVSIIPKDTEALEAGEIFSIEALTHNESHFLVTHEGKLALVTVHASNTERCEMPYTLFLNNYQKGTSLINEMLYQPPSEHYIAMLGKLNHPSWKALSI